jgi:hypothetical protein
VIADYACVADYGAGLQIHQFDGAGVEEGSKPQASNLKPQATIVRGVLFLPGDRRPGTGDRAALLDISGCRVLDLKPGPNDVSRLSPGVYFVRVTSGLARGASNATKAIVTR